MLIDVQCGRNLLSNLELLIDSGDVPPGGLFHSAHEFSADCQAAVSSNGEFPVPVLLWITKKYRVTKHWDHIMPPSVN